MSKRGRSPETKAVEKGCVDLPEKISGPWMMMMIMIMLLMMMMMIMMMTIIIIIIICL